MAKKLVVCFDGTWNTPDDKGNVHTEITDETNVVHLYRAIRGKDCAGVAGCSTKAPSAETCKWYDTGVGTNWYDHIEGGAFGFGLSRKIREGYKFLIDNYDDGDEIAVFGFSRGAYTARSLVGLIRNSGLLRRERIAPAIQGKHPDNIPLIMDAYQLYRNRDGSADTPFAIRFRAENAHPHVKIRILGVWDTVGALGIPLKFAKDFNAEQYGFHDTELSGIVENAFHAVAIDEHRGDYRPTLWAPKQKPQQTLEQAWFVGAHADVGGGYPGQPLSDIALRWMVEKVKLAGTGLEFDDDLIPKGSGLNLAEMKPTDSFGKFAFGLYKLFHDPYLRPVLATSYGNEGIHPTVEQIKGAAAGYNPKNPGLPWLG